MEYLVAAPIPSISPKAFIKPWIGIAMLREVSPRAPTPLAMIKVSASI